MARPSMRFIVIVPGFAQDDKESAHFNQRHHRLLQAKTLGLECIRCAGRSYLMRLSDDDTDFGKGFRDDEVVPAVQPPAPGKFHIDWENSRARFLSEENCAG